MSKTKTATNPRRRRRASWPLDEILRERLDAVRPTVERDLAWLGDITEDHLVRYVLDRGLRALEGGPGIAQPLASSVPTEAVSALPFDPEDL